VVQRAPGTVVIPACVTITGTLVDGSPKVGANEQSVQVLIRKRRSAKAIFLFVFSPPDLSKKS
jgi:hypothetical protein